MGFDFEMSNWDEIRRAGREQEQHQGAAGAAESPKERQWAAVFQEYRSQKQKRRKNQSAEQATAAAARSAQQQQPQEVTPAQAKHQKKFRDSSVVCLATEIEHGNVEYKYKVGCITNENRQQQLITQMKFRLSEGSGECFYYIGVEDDGYPRGLDAAELATSIALLQRMAGCLAATARLVEYVPGGFGRTAALLHIKADAEEGMRATEIRVAVAGSMDAGKSSLVAVLSQGADGQPLLDNGRGSARMAMLRHKHEIESGRTSSISQAVLGYDGSGGVLNYEGVAAPTPADITAAAAQVLHFIDLGGHEKYLKTALYGMTCMRPDYALLCVDALTGVTRTTREHLAVAVALEVPTALVVTKADAADSAQLVAALEQLQQLVAPVLGCRSECQQHQQQDTAAGCGGEENGDSSSGSGGVVLVACERQAASLAARLSEQHGAAAAGSFQQGVFPAFRVSCVSGEGLGLLHAFLSRLAPASAASSGGSSQALPGVDGGSQLWAPHGGSQAADPHSLATTTGSPAAAAAAPSAAAAPGHFQVMHTFDVEGVGWVVSGIAVSGAFEVGQTLLWGPTDEGGFSPVTIQCIQRSHVPVRRVQPGQTATLALQPPGAGPLPGCSRQALVSAAAAAQAAAEASAAREAAAAAAASNIAFGAYKKCAQLGSRGRRPGTGGRDANSSSNRTSRDASGAADASAGAAAPVVCGQQPIDPDSLDLLADDLAAELALDDDDEGDDDDGFTGHGLQGFVAFQGDVPPGSGSGCRLHSSHLAAVAAADSFTASLNATASSSSSSGSSVSSGSGSWCFELGLGEDSSSTRQSADGWTGGAGMAASASAASLSSSSITSQQPPAGAAGTAAQGVDASSLQASSALPIAGGVCASSAAAADGASPPVVLGCSPPAWRGKGGVLLAGWAAPATHWEFEARLVLLGGTWPARGLLSGAWPPAEGSEGQLAPSPASSASPEGGGGGGGLHRSSSSLKRRASKAADYAYVIHCNSIRQVARVVWMRELRDQDQQPAAGSGGGCSGDGSGQLTAPAAADDASQQQQEAVSEPGVAARCWLSASIRAAAALLQGGTGSGSDRDSSGGSGCRRGEGGRGCRCGCQLGTVVVARLRFSQRPEWLQAGARLIARDRCDGHVAAAGFVTQLLGAHQRS